MELVMSIVILGIVCSLAAMMISLIMETYMDSRSHSMEYIRMQTVLMQMAKELSSAFPPSVEITGSSHEIQFDQVLTAGKTVSIKNGWLNVAKNPHMDNIQMNMPIVFYPNLSSPRFTVKGILPGQYRIQVNCPDSYHASRYWVFHKRLQYRYNNNQIVQRVENYGKSGTAIQEQLLCDGLSGFTIERCSNNQLILEIESMDADTKQFYGLTQSISLN